MVWDLLGLPEKKEKCERCRKNPVSGVIRFLGGPKLCEDCEEEYDKERREKGEGPGFFDL